MLLAPVLTDSSSVALRLGQHWQHVIQRSLQRSPAWGGSHRMARVALKTPTWGELGVRETPTIRMKWLDCWTTPPREEAAAATTRLGMAEIGYSGPGKRCDAS